MHAGGMTASRQKTDGRLQQAAADLSGCLPVLRPAI